MKPGSNRAALSFERLLCLADVFSPAVFFPDPGHPAWQREGSRKNSAISASSHKGYDYPIPSFVKWGLNPFRWYIPFIRRFLESRQLAETTPQIRGINDPAVQRNMLYAMIFLSTK